MSDLQEIYINMLDGVIVDPTDNDQVEALTKAVSQVIGKPIVVVDENTIAHLGIQLASISVVMSDAGNGLRSDNYTEIVSTDDLMCESINETNNSRAIAGRRMAEKILDALSA